MLGGSAIDALSQSSANQKNVKLQRRQQQWEERMSNTAVQRRADDIQRAGGNRALAFTNGQEASTPSIQPARVDPITRPGSTAAAIQAGIQAKNVQANTALQLAQAKKANVEANIAQTTERAETEYRLNHVIEAYEWDDIKTKMLRSTATTTGLKTKQLEESIDALINSAKNQARKGTLDVQQLESTIDAFGMGADQKATIIQKLLQIILPLLKD